MTGYSFHNGEFFIFCNVGVPGNTGDDYDNRWIGEDFHWFGKWKSHLNQKRFGQMLNAGSIVHVFYRRDSKAPFTYAGLGKVKKIEGERPVKVIWTFPE